MGKEIAAEEGEEEEVAKKELLSTSCTCGRRSREQHTSAYVSIRQHTSAYASIRQHTSAYASMRDDYMLKQMCRGHGKSVEVTCLQLKCSGAWGGLVTLWGGLPAHICLSTCLQLKSV